jgi:uncharacterized membrane protein
MASQAKEGYIIDNTMPNFHPILVHFPIALLTIYALMELLRIKRLTMWPSWFYIKATFVILGALAAIPTGVSGLLIIQEFAVGDRAFAILSRHVIFAQLTILTFLILGITHFFAWRGGKKSRAFVDGPWSVVFATLGLVFVTITGALGGGFVHGSEVEPMVSLVFKLLGL